MAFVRNLARPIGTIVVQTPEIDLSNTEIHILKFPDISKIMWGASNENRKYLIKQIRVLYTEATDAANSNNIRIGNLGAESAHHDFSTPSGKSIGDIDVIDQSAFTAEPRVFDSEVWTQVRVVAGAGTGKIIVELEISFDYTDWVGFTPQSPN